METEVDEKIKVWAFFDPSPQNSSGQAIYPIAMNWQRRFVKFEKVLLSTTKRVGDVRILDLICASSTANFQLEYNSSDYSWRVKKVMELD